MSVDLGSRDVAMPHPAEEMGPIRLRNQRFAVLGISLLLAAGFVVLGGGSLDLGPDEARLGLAAGERLGPFGQVFGGWEPALWPGTVAPSLIWAWGEGGFPTAASVRWPAVIAGIATGLILARRVLNTFGTRAGVLMSLCWFGSLAMMDRSAGAQLDLIAGLGTVAAFDRLLGRGSGWVAGLWAAFAFLAAGWPPVALIVLTMVVIGRREASFGIKFLIPPLAAAIGWSCWALSVAPTEAWAAALTLPFTQTPAWMMAFGVLALGLPWSPFAALAAVRSVREGWPEEGRRLVRGWIQVVGASVLVGTIIPGLASAARIPALAGLAVASAAACDQAWARSFAKGARNRFLLIAFFVTALWTLIAVGGGVRLASAVSYYRPLAILLILMAMPPATLAVMSILKGDVRRALLAVALISVSLKAGHWGYYVPEWNYRYSQGPWGRAIGQWVPPRWPIYTTHTWGHDLAFATGRQVRQLAHPKSLVYQQGDSPRFVLLLDAEFDNWPEDAPALVKVASFQDEHGDGRVLARTAGKFTWRLARQTRDE